ncbi:leucyl aminopeptidase [Paenibacillus sp. D51F]
MKIKLKYTEHQSKQDWELIIRPVDAAGLQDENHATAAREEADPLSIPAIQQAVQALASKGLLKSGQSGQTMPLLGLHPADSAAFIGLSSGTLDADDIRRLGAQASKEVRSSRASAARLLVTAQLYGGTSGCTTALAGQALAEGILLGAYDRTKTTGTPKEQASAELAVYLPDGVDSGLRKEWEAGVQRGIVMAEAVAEARDLVHLPANELIPEELAEHAERLAAEYGLDCEVIDEWSALEQGMGGLLAVGKGSQHQPRMIVLHYEGDPGSEEKWGLVGKGVTFDTGGYSLKRIAGMEDMIMDMGGAAAVLGAMRIIAIEKPKVNVVAVIPAAENMISDRAFKPGDVVTMMNGMTVEIVNTDAEGRIVLADGLTTAIRRGATKLVDVATLTGAVVAAYGDITSGIMGNDDELLSGLQEASKRSGERVWPLPAYPEYRKQLDSEAADLKNKGGSYAAASIAGMFIGAFAEEKPWIHIDIAGTAWISRARGWETKGATGVMTRTLAELLLRA